MKIGIVGLPNVGKSTLFNALTGSSANVANYPFCTIDPNVGVVPVPDSRLERLAKILHAKAQIPAVVEFVDIAGLVKGASRGEGLGNQFLSHIREVDAILHVVRCFNDNLITRIDESVSPVDDFKTVELELIIADIEHLERRRNKVARQAKSNDPALFRELELIDRLLEHLDAGNTIRELLTEIDDKEVVRQVERYCLLTAKPIMVVANVSDSFDQDNDSGLNNLKSLFEGSETNVIPVSARLEAEITELPEEDRQIFFDEMRIDKSGLDRVIQESYRLLGLISFFTGNEREAHAWTIRQGTSAPSAAGTIHSDFERGFIRAEVVSFDDLKALGSFAAAREKGRIRSEGKTYVVQDGDYIVFLFNV